MFEDEDIEDISELRQLILDEIMLYHDSNYFHEYNTKKKNYNDFMKESANYLNTSNYNTVGNKNIENGNNNNDETIYKANGSEEVDMSKKISNVNSNNNNNKKNKESLFS